MRESERGGKGGKTITGFGDLHYGGEQTGVAPRTEGEGDLDNDDRSRVDDRDD